MSAQGDGPGAASVLLRLAVCVAASVVAWQVMGLVGIVITSPLYGIALARPILGALSGLHRSARAVVYRDRQGQHFAYRGQSLAIDEDDEGVRWLRVADVRKLLPHFPRDDSLAALFGERVRADDDTGEPWIHASALDGYLARSQNDASIRFKVWLQRSVIHPSPAGRAGAPLSPMPTSPPPTAPSPAPTRRPP